MKIPYMQIRGGSSKGLYFKAEDLPENLDERNKWLLLAMEGTLVGDERQIDGLGGANSLTSKVAIVSKSKSPAADLVYDFVQIVVGQGRVSTVQTCGNILAGVLHFAIETGLIIADENTTSVKVLIANTGAICELMVQTPSRKITNKGTVKIDGVPGTAAPIICNYLDTVGSSCGSLLPTGNHQDIIDGMAVTCIDNGMPLVLLKAADFGLSGHESKAILEENLPLKSKIESIRLKAGLLMHLGDVRHQTVPKMCLIAEPQNDGMISTRMFIPHVVHEAIGVLAAVSVATACLLPTAITHFLDKYFNLKNNNELVINGLNYFEKQLIIEHPSGSFEVNLIYRYDKENLQIYRSGVVRTARILSKGEVYIDID